jgi:RNA polymerase sigma-70 factor (ECF subfamily)
VNKLLDLGAWPVARGRAAQDAEQAWFDDLLDRYHSRIFNAIYRLLEDYDEAADLTQETFLRAYRNFHQFRGDSQVYTWLYRIALNLAKNRLKHLQRKAALEAYSLDEPVEAEEDSLSREVPDWSECPERRLEQKETARIVRRAIQQLPPTFKEIIVLRELQDLSYEELSQILGISMGAVKSRLFRARARLKELLEPSWDVLVGG